VSDDDPGSLFFYSAHAPTLLGFLATLKAGGDFLRDGVVGADGGGSSSTTTTFVGYGSALIVEIHVSASRNQRYFVLKHKDGDHTYASHLVLKDHVNGVGCGQDNDDDDDNDDGTNNNNLLSLIPKASWCLLDEVESYAKDHALLSDRAWCRACGNAEADVCLRTNIGGGGGGGSGKMLDAWMESSESIGSYTNSDGPTFVICALFFGGFFAGVAAMGLVWICNRNNNRNNNSNNNSNDNNNDNGGGGGEAKRARKEEPEEEEVEESLVVIANGNKEIC